MPAAIGLRVAVGVWLGAWVLGQLAASLVVAARGRLDDPVPDLLTLGLVAAVVWAVWVAGLWVAERRGGSGDWRSDYAVYWRPVDLWALPAGVLAQLFVVPGVYLPLRAVWPDTFSDERVRETARSLVERADDVVGAVGLVIVVAIGAPIVEEFVYRGMLQRSLTARLGTGRGARALAVVVVALWFALIHLRPIEIPGLFAAGVVFGAALALSGRLGAAVLAHLAFNVTGLVAVWSG